jgi:hypothetical protein
LRQPLALGANVFVLSLIVLLILHLQHRLNRISIFLLYGVLIPARVLIGVSQGFLAPAIIVGLATLMTYATLRRRIPWLFVAAGFGIFALIQPVKASLRSQVWANGTANREQSEADKLQALSSATQLGMEFADTFGFQAAVSIAVERLSMLVLFEKVIAYTPSDIPYWEGETYYPLLFKPIPRALWEDKPDETRANELGHRYAFINPEDYTTAINLPQLIEFYGNFGPLGVVVGCLFMGLLYRTVHSIFIHQKMGLGSLASGLFILSLWLDIESNFSLIIGGILGVILSIIAFHMLVTVISNSRLALQRSSIAIHAAESN